MDWDRLQKYIDMGEHKVALSYLIKYLREKEEKERNGKVN